MQIVLGLETSCDECSASLVADGRQVLSNVVVSQIDIHAPYQGVVPELASRAHASWIDQVVVAAVEQGLPAEQQIAAVAVANRPGLVGSLMVGVAFAKAFAASKQIPLLAIDHIKAHLHAAFIEQPPRWPFLGVAVSGGHTIICRVDSYDSATVLATTVDDACGEAFDKVAKHYDLGFPGGAAIDRLARQGNPLAYQFPQPRLHKSGQNPLDISYSGLKTAAIHQLNQFKQVEGNVKEADIAASFQRCAIDLLLDRIRRALKQTGLDLLVVGGGVSANSYLRAQLGKVFAGVDVLLPALKYCTDNGAMIASLGYYHLVAGNFATHTLKAYSRATDYHRHKK